LVRSEGDPSISDSVVNEVYDNLEIIHRFFKDVFGWKIPDNKGKTLSVTVHYGDNYDNGFWQAKQLVLGDGDGETFRKGGFTTLSSLAFLLSDSVRSSISQLEGEGQTRALEMSFGDIFSCLVEQWLNKQTPDKASWLVGASLFAPGFKGKALRDMAHPGTAYDDPRIGKDPQPGHMKDYVQTDSDDGGKHINSGIPSKAFYELANKLKGYAWEKPGKIWFGSYRTLKPKSKFQDLANATLDVAEKTYGEQSPESEAVIQSWTAVGITVGSTTQKP
jgi:Zn-dependent metalloprotease